MSTDLLSDLSIPFGLAPSASPVYSTTSETPHGVQFDLAGVEDPVLILSVNEYQSSTLVGYAYLQHSDDRSVWTSIPNANLIGAEDSGLVDGALVVHSSSHTGVAAEIVRVGLRNTKRYVRMMVEITSGTGGFGMCPTLVGSVRGRHGVGYSRMLAVQLSPHSTTGFYATAQRTATLDRANYESSILLFKGTIFAGGGAAHVAYHWDEDDESDRAPIPLDHMLIERGGAATPTDRENPGELFYTAEASGSVWAQAQLLAGVKRYVDIEMSTSQAGIYHWNAILALPKMVPVAAQPPILRS